MPDQDQPQGTPHANPETTVPPPEPVFSLARFENNCYARNHEPAAREFMELLRMLDRNYGALDTGFVATPTINFGVSDRDPHIINRICSALSTLFSDPDFSLSIQGFQQLLFLHRWIATLFASSSFRNADHILRALNMNGPDTTEVQIKNEHIAKFCILFTPNSELPINLDALWAFDKNLTAALACALISPRFLGTPAAHHKREVVLQWLPPHMEEIEDINVLPVAVLHDIYMHSTYAELPERHAIKTSINRLVRKKIVEGGFEDLKYEPVMDKKSGKPVMLVVLEWFSGSHSVYRTHSSSLRGCKKHFHLVGLGSDSVDDLGKGVFDEFFLQETADIFSNIRKVREFVEKYKPAIIYYPAIGMFPLTIFLSNQRLAPLQVTSLGHAATTCSPYIDYFIVDEDFYGDPNTFTEKLISMPKNGMPHVPSAALIPLESKIRENPEIVRIAVSATTMKINPNFLYSCHRIQTESKIPIRFEFFMGLARGLVYLEVKYMIDVFIHDAIINTHLDYPTYLNKLNECDLFINPYPYGNMNSIVDVVTLGLVGVCKTGPALHEHIDDGMFRRMGFPDWLIAKNDDEYVAAVIRLANNTEERVKLRKKIIEKKAVEIMFKGDTELLGKLLLEKVNEKR